jgi:hypothetical protein
MSEKNIHEFTMDFENGIITENIILDENYDMECRICLGDDKENIIRPCNCNSLVHIECLKEWMLTVTNKYPTQCEICKSNYNINFAAIFPEQQYNTSIINIVQRNNINNNNIWTTNALNNQERLNTIIMSERSLRNSRNNKCVKRTLIILGIGDFFFGIIYFFFCQTDEECKEITGFTTISISMCLIMIWLCDKIL